MSPQISPDPSDQKCALVTGGAQNIGLAVSQRLQADGWRVFVLDITEPQDPGLHADFHQIDLSNAKAAQSLLADLAAKHRFTCLVNNVGVVKPALLADVNPDDFDAIMHVNLRPSILAAQALIPGMRAAGGGRIIMNTSRVTLGKPARTLYSATKGAAQSMARTWALELAGDNITVNCVGPGPIATTAFWDNNPPDAPETRAITDAVPLKRMGTPQDVANAVGFFASEDAGFVTGQTLFVCGGTTVG
ncbi:MAG: SDR family NAD(P)-dependent oxidoreductase [Sulfitobacter sp.]